MVMPNFIILGAAKSGTTALYHYLKQHLQVYMSFLKETEFFAFEGEKLNFTGPGDMPRASITTLEAYQAQFSGVTQEIAIGEASPLYLYSPKAPERICHYIPNAKLVVILRSPIERAYSQYLMFIRDGREPSLDFATALAEETRRQQKNWAWGWNYVDVGFYYSQLKRYFEIFDPTQIKIYLYEDLKTSPVELIQDLFGFIGVDSTFIPDMSKKPNISGIPKNQILHQFTTQSNFLRSISKPVVPSAVRGKISKMLRDQVNRDLLKPKISPEIHEKLILTFQDDILNLQDLIQRDLSAWTKRDLNR
jgi:Sulfotransferase family